MNYLRIWRTCILVFALLGLTQPSWSQADSLQTFDLDLEFRPRSEFRYGYKTLVPKGAKPSFFISNRLRLTSSYKRANFRFHASLQDVRTFGAEGLVADGNHLGLFEGFVEMDFSKRWMMKIGRQSVDIDNGRLLAEANWGQNGMAHDGLTLLFRTKKIKNALYGFYNQSQENTFGSDYSLSTSMYKEMLVNYFEYNPSDKWSFNLLNVVDGWDSQSVENTTYVRATSGGKIQWKSGKYSATLRSYYQYGQLSTGQSIHAQYVQPEIHFNFSRNKINLGAEYLSGDDDDNPSVSRSFVPLYGVNFRFMGNLNYFTQFPNDVLNGGLFNPYLIYQHQLTKQWRLQSDLHFFMLPNEVSGYIEEITDGYLGSELDIKAKYEVNSYTTLDFGFAGMIPTTKMEAIKLGDSGILPFWSFVMVTFQPNLFHITN